MAELHYKSKSAHLSVMAELAWRNYNVAMPEIDIGDDIFAVNDTSGNMWRLQVKYSQAKYLKSGDFAGTFTIPKEQLEKSTTPELYYVLCIRDNENKWWYLIFPRAQLEALYQNSYDENKKKYTFGSIFTNINTKKENLNFYITFINNEPYYGGKSLRNKKSLKDYLYAWNKLPNN